MNEFTCDWCKAQITSGERMISLSLSNIIRKPKRWGALDEYFDNDVDVPSYHAWCFTKNSSAICEELFPYGTQEPRKISIKSGRL